MPGKRPENRPKRKPIRARQPASTSGLRPSQRRASERRDSLKRSHAAEHWLRRLARL